MISYEFLKTHFFAILGPCVIESLDHTLYMADRIKEIAVSLNLPVVFKASFDKANRSSYESFRGPGLDEGLRILRKVKEQFSLPILTDIHLPSQATEVSQVADIIQIPAFLCRQTDLLVAAAHTKKIINIKKGQFVAPADMLFPVEKCQKEGNETLFLTERGYTFGYNNLVVDMRSFPIMSQFAPVIFDATHSAQLPGGGRSTQGERLFIPSVAKAAVAAGASGIFIETHQLPEKAKSDASTVYPLDSLKSLLQELLAIHSVVK